MNKDGRKEVATIKQFIKLKVHSQGGRAKRFHEVELALGSLGIVYLLCLSGLGRAKMYSRVISNEDCF